MGLKIQIDLGALVFIYDSNEGRLIGTGFVFIKPNWVVTAKHVAYYDDRKNEPRPNLSILNPGRDAHVEASLIFTHPQHDLAVMELRGESFCKTPLYPGYEEFTGKNGLIVAGYSPEQSRTKGRPMIYVNSVEKYEREHREWDEPKREERLITFDASFGEGGNSGGPVLGEGGGVVAVSTQLFREQDNDTYKIRATSILPLLEYLSF